MRNGEISGTIAKQVINHILLKGGSAIQIIKKQNLKQVTDRSAVLKFVKRALSENKNVIADIQRNPNAFKFLLGQIMRLSKGRVNPKAAEKLLREELRQKQK